MNNITFLTENNIKKFILNGKIDSSNSEEILAYVSNKVFADDSVKLDFDKVSYISSAGLRFVLKIAKSCKDFEVINVSPNVYDIFDMTGFNQMIKVSKAMRVISIEGKELIGEGYMGKVYRLDEDTIIKVFVRNSSIEDIQREIGLAKKAFVAGLPTAIPFDVVRVKEGGYGSVFELLKSNCFNKLFINHPENTDKYIKMYIDLLKTIIDTTIEDPSLLPSKKDLAYEWIEADRKYNLFDEETLTKLTKLVDSIPGSNHLVHGDFHIKNIMMQGDDPLLIDMDTLGVGHPIFEFTAFFLTYIGYPSTDPGNIESFLGISQEVANRLFYESVNTIYADRSEIERKEIIDKCSLLGYMWLAGKTMQFDPDDKLRVSHAQDEVLRLINKYDSLNF